MDVEALYPSIDVDFAVDKCVELLKESHVTFKNVNTDELGLYIALLTNEEERNKEGINKYCATRIRKGKRPTITGCGSYKDDERRWLFHHKAEVPIKDPLVLKNILSYAIGIAIKATLKNHMCTFNNKIFKQMKGGAIGVGIAGEVANLFMVWWDRKMKTLCVQQGIKMKLYSRYVDDTNIVVKAIETDVDENKEEKTMKKLQEIANSIHASIKVTTDFPSNHENGRMPILDTEQWIENVKIGNIVKPQILHSHYSKSMTSKYVTLRNSAMPYQNKMSILIADLIRIMRNVSLLCKDEERTKMVQEYLLRLQHSGYNKVERHIIYIKSKRKYESIKRNAKNGICPMYRSKFWNRNERRQQKIDKRKTWYNNKGKFDSVFFVNYTEKSKLAKECQKVINDIGLKIRVVEKSGKNLKQELVRSNPFGKQKCTTKCEICENHPKVDCKSRELVYEINCDGRHSDEKQINYGGETSRSIAERFNEHCEDIKNKKSDTPIYKHFLEEHNGMSQPIILKVIKRCPSDAMLRQATEAVYIRENDPVLNRKTEFENMNIAQRGTIRRQ